MQDVWKLLTLQQRYLSNHIKMKKRLLTILFLMTALFCYGQEESGHLLFKGIPIDGTVSSFCKKLKKKGFREIGKINGKVSLEGNFASYDKCSIIISSNLKTNMTSEVTAIFEALYSWDLLENQYNILKRMLTIKYGEPSKVDEYFYDYKKDDPSLNESAKMAAFLTNRCKYSSLFETDKGDIYLIIVPGDLHGNVGLYYHDKINNPDIILDALDDL